MLRHSSPRISPTRKPRSKFGIDNECFQGRHRPYFTTLRRNFVSFVARRPPGGTWSLLGRMLLIDKSFNSTTRSTDETQWRCRHLLRVVCHELEGWVVSSWTPKRSCRSANFNQNNSRNCVLTITPVPFQVACWKRRNWLMFLSHSLEIIPGPVMWYRQEPALSCCVS